MRTKKQVKESARADVEMPQPTRRQDWSNYVNPKDQARARSEKRYRIGRSVEVVTRAERGAADLTLQCRDQEVTVRLTRVARQRLAAVLVKG